jgi:hypothetical protein
MRASNQKKMARFVEIYGIVDASLIVVRLEAFRF